MARLFVLLARASNEAVILRRGPSKQVRMVRWDTATDRTERGQWLAGRVYEHRADLSPDGRLIVYCAATHKRSIPVWTAVSRPPFFTALALWPKVGTYGGGGLFLDDRHLALNHRESELPLAEGFSIPSRYRVTRIEEWGGLGEDRPIASVRLEREGWLPIEKSGESRESLGRVHPHRPLLCMERHLLGMFEPNHPLYLFDYALRDLKRGRVHPLGRLDWADWDKRGDLVFAREGRLFRAKLDDQGRPKEEKLVVDLRDDVFENLPPPPEAKRWP